MGPPGLRRGDEWTSDERFFHKLESGRQACPSWDRAAPRCIAPRRRWNRRCRNDRGTRPLGTGAEGDRHFVAIRCRGMQAQIAKALSRHRADRRKAVVAAVCAIDRIGLGAGGRGPRNRRAGIRNIVDHDLERSGIGWRSRVLEMPACEAVEHGFDGCDLPPGLNGIIEVRVTPPIPAPERVEGCESIGSGIAYDGLRIKDDQAVRVGPLVIAGMLDVMVLNGFEVLLAAVECDMHAAGLLGGTRRRNVNIPGLGHAVGGRGFGRRQLPLIECDELSGKRAAVLGVEGAVYVLENYASLIVVAMVEEVAFIFVAWLTVIDRHLGMPCADCRLIEHIAVSLAAQVMQIEAVSSVSNFWIDDRVVVTGKDVDALVRNVVRVINVPAAGPFVGFFEERLKIWG